MRLSISQYSLLNTHYSLLNTNYYEKKLAPLGSLRKK